MNPLLSAAASEELGRTRHLGVALLVALLAAGVAYVFVHLFADLAPVGPRSAFPYLLLGVALAIALGFEFVNGFHFFNDTATTEIYTHSLTPNVAVIWSGLWNFLGVMASTGARSANR
ncbi:phosphate transporter family protein [Burkholderia pseudomallei]|nr:phosphate transporter family protein [Burkholderia pseudomallei]